MQLQAPRWFANFIALFISIFWLTGCVTNQKIVVPSYTAPAEIQKIESLKSGGETAEGAYLSFAINPDLTFASNKTNQQDQALLTRNLLTELDSQITEVSFITIHPIYDLASVVLDMEVFEFDYQDSGKQRTANLSVNFSLTKGATKALSKTYQASDFRVATDASRLPSKETILQTTTKNLVKKFVSDISPTRTNQLREFLPLPSKLEHVFGYIKQGNYLSAIEDMEKFTGKPTLEYYYDLAILYEAQGSKTEDLATSAKAKQAYEAAIQAGGNSNKLVVEAKARFDNFYRLLQLTQAQKQQNQQLNQELNQQYMLE